MEKTIQTIADWAAGSAVELAAVWTVVLVFGTLMFGRGYKKKIARLIEQSADAKAQLAAQQSQISILQSGPTVLQIDVSEAGKKLTEEAIREALRAEGTATKQLVRMKEAVSGLEQFPFGDGYSYAELPEGTRVVTLPDGSIRLAMPIRLSAEFGGFHVHVGTPSVTLDKGDAE